MDIDIEEMLEAPFKAQPPSQTQSLPVPSSSSSSSVAGQDDLNLYAGLEEMEDKSRERPRERERDRDRDRERKRDRDRDTRDRDTRDPRERERDRDRDRERDRDRRLRRSSRSRSPRRESRDRREEPREPREPRVPREARDREREPKEPAEREKERDKDRERDRERDRGHHRNPPRPSREELIQIEIERDSRTVFIMQLAARVRESDISSFFEQNGAGKVRDVRLVTDRISRKSKGVGYVEFYERASVQRAIALTGTKLLGIPIIATHTESEKNRLAEEAARAAAMAQTEASTGGPVSSALARLYVGSIDFSLTEEDIRTLFEVHGEIEFVNLHKDTETGRSKGFAFIQFKRDESARNALEKMHGYELKGRQLKVGYSTEADKSGLAYNINSGSTGITVITPGLPAISISTSHHHAMTMNGGLEDEEKAGVAMTAQSRAALMAKLARRDEPGASAATVPLPAKPHATEVTATRCVLLKNMFDPENETDEGWDVEIRNDVKDECEKYGKIVHIAVDKNSQGFIYIKFDAIPYAQQAINALNGRFFAGKQISATFMLEIVYHAKYPEAAYL
ncbi:hypothetical protein HK100_003640 [Physocladia obscura]|uniref:RRM domain-containing protein n=1 Tax=Physocladia obscura TaxID=109957 RepID=A0AAD5SVC9_9FUNG|nr:hypothetical protein HK100_003640 [Physocladia obscura]